MKLHAYVGRQAIFNRKLEVVGYELLYRDGFESSAARFESADAASATTMINACLELGLDELTQGLPIWVNLPASFLLGDLPLMLPPRRTVVEVLETVRVTPALLTSLEQLRRDGFQIALDDFVPTSDRLPLLEVADIVKIDVLGLDPDELAKRFAMCRGRRTLMLAEKVESQEVHSLVSKLGFDLFQGYFFEKPVIARAGRMSHNRAVLLSLLGKLYDPRTNYRDLEKLLSGEIGLTVRLFKLAGSVASSRGEPLGSVAQAVARLGTAQVAGLVVLLVTAGFDDKPVELVRQALIRAKTCEGLARLQNLPADELFTAGLLSLLDGLFDQPMDVLLAELPITPLIKDVILGRGNEDTAKVLRVACAQGRGDFAAIERCGVPASMLFTVWYDAVRWADQMVGKLATR